MKLNERFFFIVLQLLVFVLNFSRPANLRVKGLEGLVTEDLGDIPGVMVEKSALGPLLNRSFSINNLGLGEVLLADSCGAWFIHP
ncbi:MAG: hypothetical protein V4689_12765 [Verrucomicrobiota bacterium]